MERSISLATPDQGIDQKMNLEKKGVEARRHGVAKVIMQNVCVGLLIPTVDNQSRGEWIAAAGFMKHAPLLPRRHNLPAMRKILLTQHFIVSSRLGRKRKVLKALGNLKIIAHKSSL